MSSKLLKVLTGSFATAVALAFPLTVLGTASSQAAAGLWTGTSVYTEPIRIPFASSLPPRGWQRTEAAQSLAPLLRRSPLEDAGERRIRIQEFWHRPMLAEPPVKVTPKSSAAVASAVLFEAVGDHVAARFAYRHAIELGETSVKAWRGLGRAEILSGDAAASEGAFLAALDAAEKTVDPIAFVELRAAIHRDLAKLYLLDGRARDAEIALEAAEGLAVRDRLVANWIQRNLFLIRAGGYSPAHAPVPAWPEHPAPGVLDQLGETATIALDALPLEVRDHIASGIEWASVGRRRRTVLTIGFGTLALLVLLRMIRQRGDMTVAIEYPDELRGVFRVHIATSQGRWTSAMRAPLSEIMKGGISTRHEHHLVNRETHFQRLLSRRYYVTVEGALMDPDTQEVLTEVREQKVARVRHRRTVRVEYDVRPEKCPVDIHVLWDELPAEDVAVVALDLPETLKRDSGSSVRMFLPKGIHRLVVGCGDRVVERQVDIQSYQPAQLRFDLAGANVVFKGCPPAVEPYLRGDIDSVARALERDGQATRAYLMLAELNRELGEEERAADYFESAGDHLQAAELRASLGDNARAATLFARAGDPLSAAEMYRIGGDFVQAGQCYEQALDFDLAIQCYQEADDMGRWINALERRGETFLAAKVALEHDERPRAIRLLQCIAPEDDDYAEASYLLTAAFERERHWDLAAQRMEQHLATYKPGTAPADKYAKYADLLEQAGQIERALDVFDDLRRREPTYPNVAARIETLRKQRSAADRLSRFSGGSIAVGDAPTEFLGEYRYEIIEEIGRGGMGVVFKARDRRLDRVVALKRLPEDLKRHHPKAVQLFLREAQAAARLNHPNIVTVHDADQEDGCFFITMELLDGAPFHRILSDNGPLSTTHMISVGLQVATGLEYAHSQGIIHRDIKTANLFLTSDKIVKIMDFGLAKMLEEVRGGTTVVSGTPFYMSPEQITGAEVSRQTDLYSFGVTLFELTTGQVPFKQGDIAYHHRHTPVPDPRDVRSDVPPSVCELIMNLMAKETSERCPSAGELRARLESLQRSLVAL